MKLQAQQTGSRARAGGIHHIGQKLAIDGMGDPRGRIGKSLDPDGIAVPIRFMDGFFQTAADSFQSGFLIGQNGFLRGIFFDDGGFTPQRKDTAAVFLIQNAGIKTRSINVGLIAFQGPSLLTDTL